MDTWNSLKDRIAEQLHVEPSQIQEPEGEGFGDFSYPCFGLAKEQGKNPAEIAKVVAGSFKLRGMAAKPIGPYVNFYIDWASAGEGVLKGVSSKYGGNFAKGKVLIEHSSINPNASPHVGRARNAIIGDTLVRLMRFAGYKTEVHYYVNDVGKQIVLLVWASRGKKLKFHDLLNEYVKANELLEKDKSVEQEIFKFLQRFEKGDKKAIKQIKDIVKISLDGQKSVLAKLNIYYDSFDFESDYIRSKKTEKVLKALEKTGQVFVDDDGRKVVKYKNTHFVLTRSDGTSLYMLRDVAYALDKAAKGKDVNVIVLGEEQKLYFEQLSYLLGLLNAKPPKVVHYSFVLLEGGKKMSTRKGEVVLVEDMIKEVKEKASEELKRRYPGMKAKDIDKLADSITVASIRYGTIRISPEKNIIFNIDEAVRFEGDTGPYLQYTHARASSILRKSKKRAGKFNAALLKEQKEIELLRLLARYPSVVRSSLNQLRPNILSSYLYSLAETFNNYYQNVPVLKAEKKVMLARLKLVDSVRVVMKSGLSVLGIDAPEKM